MLSKFPFNIQKLLSIDVLSFSVMYFLTSAMIAWYTNLDPPLNPIAQLYGAKNSVNSGILCLTNSRGKSSSSASSHCYQSKFVLSILSLCNPNKKLGLKSLLIGGGILFVVTNVKNLKMVMAYMFFLLCGSRCVTIDLITYVMSAKGPATFPFMILANVLMKDSLFKCLYLV